MDEKLNIFYFDRSHTFAIKQFELFLHILESYVFRLPISDWFDSLSFDITLLVGVDLNDSDAPARVINRNQAGHDQYRLVVKSDLTLNFDSILHYMQMDHDISYHDGYLTFNYAPLNEIMATILDR